MDNVLSIIVQSTVIISFVCGVFSYVILKPLQNAISDLRSVVNDMRREIKNADAERHKIELRLTAVEQSVKSAHHRLDNHDKLGGNVYMKVSD